MENRKIKIFMKIFVLLLLFLLPGISPGQSVKDCMECHSDQDLTGTVNDTMEVSMYVNLGNYKESVHADLACIDCHSTIKDIDHPETLPAVDCGQCHEDSQEEFNQSIHTNGVDLPPGIKVTCASCHSKHHILPADNPASTIYPLNIENTCGNCHSNPVVLNALGIRGEGPVALYHNSVHNKVLHEDPEKGAPTCINCHDYHAIYVITDPRSKFSKMNVAATCGSCHVSVDEAYEKSIHAKSLKKGHFGAPTCNDCHGEHHIESPEEKDAVTNKLNLSSQICAKCHASETLMSRFGLDYKRFTSYSRTYHGLAVLSGSPEAANCTSCHEVHAIMSQTNPKSSVNPANLEKTCSKCHKDVTKAFTQITVHPENLESRNPIGYYAKRIYIWLIVITIGGMVIHNIVIYTYYIRRKKLALKNSRTYQRFQRFEVYQHSLLIISFVTLVITGFALKFPEAFWVEGLNVLGLTEELRGLIHRGAAVVLITISFVQLFYFIASRKGRKEIGLLLPKISDIQGFIQNMRFYLGKTKEHPKFGRWDYTEKAEYLALIWGTAVMAMTGFVLWFPEFFIRYLPSWVFEFSEIVHYFEAWLATLAILVWHWFFVIYHPEKYPMSLTWLDGKISEEELKKHHSLEYEELNKGQTNKSSSTFGNDYQAHQGQGTE
jgi:formate dehydrogenase gamma subunit